MPLSLSYQRNRQILSTPLSNARGVGPRLSATLARMGLNTIEDALYTLPHRYEDRREIRKISQLRNGFHEVFSGRILAAGESTTSRNRRRLYEVVVGDGSGQILLKWFHFRPDWMKKRFQVGRTVLITGEVRFFGPSREVHHPEVEFVPEGESAADFFKSDQFTFGRILPVYPLTEGLHQKTARKIWKDVVDRFGPFVSSPIPESIRQHRSLMPLDEALVRCHWPPDEENIAELEEGRGRARRTLVYDEFFYLELGLALKRRGLLLEAGIPFNVTHRYTRPLSALLPYRLTDAQRRVLGEIKRDMMAPQQMNRLLQGDVGSGKTIVALMAALIAIENDTQVAVVAPTEILAEQHFLQFHHWCEDLGIRTAFLSGSTSAKDRREILQALEGGKIQLIVGTHALLEEDILFHRLGLGIVDEQHRFGVRQRGVLRQKGTNPDILVMTATPIPRTLTLTLYGDLSLSVIDQLPPGRTPVRTRVLPESSRQRAYDFIKKELAAGRQAYVVYPLVEESEKSDLSAASEGAAFLQQKVFDKHRVGLIHGRMRPDEKDSIMSDFKSGQIDILVSTTVIEVGIDVPNASVIMIEHAERFGLAQLHQLRGRVGRGTHTSYCFLLHPLRCSEEGRRRLQIMEETTDGFRIAEEDLAMRGPGEFLGTRQAGVPDFRVANLLRDGRILEEAREDALRLVNEQGFPNGEKFDELFQVLIDRWGNRLELASVG